MHRTRGCRQRLARPGLGSLRSLLVKFTIMTALPLHVQAGERKAVDVEGPSLWTAGCSDTPNKQAVPAIEKLADHFLPLFLMPEQMTTDQK